MLLNESKVKRLITPPDKVSDNELNTIKLLANTINKNRVLHTKERLKNIVDPHEASEITAHQVSNINELIKIFTHRYKAYTVKVQLDSINVEKAKVSQQIKESVAIITDCPNCGESVVVDARVMQ